MFSGDYNRVWDCMRSKLSLVSLYKSINQILFLFHFFALFFSSVSECFVGKIQGKQTLKNEHLTVFQEVQHWHENIDFFCGCVPGQNFLSCIRGTREFPGQPAVLTPCNNKMGKRWSGKVSINRGRLTMGKYERLRK